MMTEKEKKEAKKLRTFEVVAFGCHDRAYSRLAAFIRGAFRKTDTFMFVEYFSVYPTVYSASNRPEGDSLKVFFPFIRRIVDENQFLWIPQTDGWVVPDKDSNKNKKNVDDKNVKDDCRLEPRMRDLNSTGFGRPEKFNTNTENWSIGHELLSLWQQGAHPTTDVDKFVRPFGKDEQDTYFKNVHSEPRPKNDPYRREYALLVHPWRMGDQNTTLIQYPLATKAVFYGYLIVLLPETITEIENDKKVAFMEALGDISQTLYLPVLTLLRESFLERQLVDAIEEEEAETTWKDRAETWFRISDKDIPFRPCNDGAVKSEENKKRAKRKPILHKCCPAKDRPYHLDYELPLHRCWLWRDRYLRTLSGEKEDDRREFLRRLPLAKYFIASPGLVENMKLVMGANFEMPKEGEKLEAALVYGGPGSGKDVMAQLVSIFSEQYFHRAMHTINMAAIRPAAITGPLLQGLRLSGPSVRDETEDLMQLADRSTQLQGLFLQAKERGLPKEGEAAKELGTTFILDELNSLDVDLQGVLLRVLEQGEVMPLGGLCKDYVQHLIVGIVNEDPEQITREKELRDLLVEKGKLGSLFSGLLYETLRRTRRLRDDLYHRLKRQLYIRVPEIKDRRPDIPMLFYVEACKEAKRLDKEPIILVELSAYRLLMDPALAWPGNVRQIQAIAEKAVRAASDDTTTNKAKAGTDDLSILRSHVQKALTQEFGDVFGGGNGRGAGETGDG